MKNRLLSVESSKHHHEFYIVNLDGEMYLPTLEALELVLLKSGFKSKTIGCNGGLLQCIPKQIASPKVTASPCKRCMKKQMHLQQYKSLDLKIGREKKDLPKQIQSVLEINRYDLKLLRDIEYEGYKIFRMAGFDYLMQSRNISLVISNSHDQKLYQSILCDIINLLENLEKLKDENSPNKIFIATNGNYSLNRLLATVAKKEFGGFLSLEFEPLRNTGRMAIRLLDSGIPLDPNFYDSLDAVEKFRPIRHSLYTLSTYSRRFKGKAQNSFVNTGVTKIQDLVRFNTFVGDHEEIRTLFLSSSEEVIAHLYANDEILSMEAISELQQVYIRDIINNARLHPHIGFIVRAHPRQGISKKSDVISKEWELIKNYLDAIPLPSNVSIFSPESEITSFEIAVESNLVFVLWSSIGIETMLLGIPTIYLHPEFSMFPVQRLTVPVRVETHGRENLFFSNTTIAWNDIKVLWWLADMSYTKWRAIPVALNSSLRYASMYETVFILLNRLSRFKSKEILAVFIDRNLLSKLIWHAEKSRLNKLSTSLESKTIALIQYLWRSYWRFNIKRRKRKKLYFVE